MDKELFESGIRKLKSELMIVFWAVCGRTYGHLIKSPAEDLPQDTEQNQSSAKEEDS